MTIGREDGGRVRSRIGEDVEDDGETEGGGSLHNALLASFVSSFLVAVSKSSLTHLKGDLSRDHREGLFCPSLSSSFVNRVRGRIEKDDDDMGAEESAWANAANERADHMDVEIHD